MGCLADVGTAPRDQASLAAPVEDVVKTSAIDGETLNLESVRSPLARRLGVDIGALAPADRQGRGGLGGDAREPWATAPRIRPARARRPAPRSRGWRAPARRPGRGG